MPAGSVNLNGLTFKQLGLHLVDTPRFPSPPTRRVIWVPVAGRMGGVVTQVTYDPKTLPINVLVLATTPGTREAAEDILKDLANSGEVILRVDNGLGTPREIRGYLNGDAPIEVYRPALGAGAKASRATIPLLCPTPLWQHAEPVTASVGSGSALACLLGTAPSDPIIRVRGTSGGAPVVITVKDSAGRQVQSLTLPALTANDWYELDMRIGSGVIKKSIAGVLSVDQNLYTAGVFPFALDPQDGDFRTLQYPSIECSAGRMLLVYWRRFL